MSAPFSANPFIRPDFWGRATEIDVITERLRSKQSIPIIGEPFIGRSTLLRQLMQLARVNANDGNTFVYLDCQPYIQLAKELPNENEFPSTQFRWELYTMLWTNGIKGSKKFDAPRHTESADELINLRYDLSIATEEALHAYTQDNPDRQISFLLDNFEGIAGLHMSNMLWLRSLVAAGDCVCVVTSRYALYILLSQHPDSLNSPSPLWNIFSDPLYLGLMREDEVREFLATATELAGKNGSHWHAQDVQFIRRMAGRHPELLRIACARMFDERVAYPFQPDDEKTPDYNFLALRIQQDTKAICAQLWQGLADRALLDELDTPIAMGIDSQFSVFQQALLDISYGYTPSNMQVLFILEQRGLIEQERSEWCIFSDVMRTFVQKQSQAAGYTLPTTKTPPEKLAPTEGEQSDVNKNGHKPFTFTYKEGKVYEYLRAHLGEVCDRNAIMQAVWGTDSPSSYSALQKAVERLRVKIADDINSPYKLISVRGRGYMLRKP